MCAVSIWKRGMFGGVSRGCSISCALLRTAGCVRTYDRVLVSAHLKANTTMYKQWVQLSQVMFIIRQWQYFHKAASANSKSTLRTLSYNHHPPSPWLVYFIVPPKPIANKRIEIWIFLICGDYNEESHRLGCYLVPPWGSTRATYGPANAPRFPMAITHSWRWCTTWRTIRLEVTYPLNGQTPVS